MIRFIICGAAGRMGRRTINQAAASKDFEVVGAVESSGHPELGKDAGELAGTGRNGVAVTDDLSAIISRADAVIDFSAPQAAEGVAAACAESGTPLVICTTGLSAAQEKAVTTAAERIACVYAANTSTGINLLLRLVSETAAALGDEYDVEIVEAHHRFKKDAPSGTAVTIARQIAAELGRDLETDAVYGREGATGERTRKEIGIHAVRAGDIVGEHTVIFSAPGERLELTHRAHSRDTFALGALRAARFAVSAPPGLYSMKEVLGK